MSPLQIPGTSIKVPSKTAICNFCGQKYSAAVIKKRDDNYITSHCPCCNAIQETFSYDVLEAQYLLDIQPEFKTPIEAPSILKRVKPKVFISYAKEDYSKAIEVYNNLVNHGYLVWMDKKDLLPGQYWEQEIEKAIRSSDYFVACLSSCAISKRGFYQKEIRFALDVLATIPFGKIYFIPLRLEPCDVPSLLQPLHWIDLDSPDVYEKIFKALDYNCC